MTRRASVVSCSMCVSVCGGCGGGGGGRVVKEGGGGEEELTDCGGRR